MSAQWRESSPLHPRHRQASRSGFTLVICLLLLMLLCIGATSFVAMSSGSRASAHAFAEKTIAEAAAKSAVAAAASLIAEKIAQYPDSATAWHSIRVPSAAAWDFEGTVLHLRESAVHPSSKTYLLPLVSRPDAEGNLLEEFPAQSWGAALGPDLWSDQNSVNLNAPRFYNDLQGWMGSPPSTENRASHPRPFRARWVELRSVNPLDNTPEKTLSRYAFWVEDESFKVHFDLLGKNLSAHPDTAVRGMESESPGAGPAEIPLLGLLAGLTLPQSLQRAQLALDASLFRARSPGEHLLELRALNHASSTSNGFQLGDATRFLATLSSASLNLSRHGSQRLNLNNVLGLEEPSLDWRKYAPDNATVERQVKQIVEAIRFHSPQFGERFYRTQSGSSLDSSQVQAKHREIYLHKIAANIRDTIDPDLQPTLIDSSGHVLPEKPPTSAINADVPDALWAQGKDSGPYLQEAAVRCRSEVSGGRYRLRLDYYVEFWNMGDRDIYAAPQSDVNEPHALGDHPFLRVSNQQAWLASPSGSHLKGAPSGSGDPTQHPKRDLIIDLSSGVFRNGKPVPSGVCFRAGQATVLTTDPDYLNPPKPGTRSPDFSGGYNINNIYFCSQILNGRREYTGSLPTRTTKGIKPDFRDGNEDYDTEIVLGTERGIIDSHPAAIAMGGGPRVTSTGKEREDWYGGSLLGNGLTPSQLGDPRTNNESLHYTRFLSGASTGQPDQARYFNTVSAPRFSLGHPNDLYLNPQLRFPWPDYYKGWVRTSNSTPLNPSAAFTPTRPCNGKRSASGVYSPGIASIGTLGDVFDPARVVGTRGSLGIGGARGGGRTLRIGQSDDLINRNPITAASRQWAAWRLTDYLGTSSQIQTPGLININGIRRDGGAALRAACHGMVLASIAHSPKAYKPTLSLSTLNTSLALPNPAPGFHRFLREATERLENAGPLQGCFHERGEISELDLFNTDAETLVSGTKMSTVFDHSREELCRRILELVTCRGSVFTVYAIGQAVRGVQPDRSKLRVTGEHRLKTTFALLPRNADGTPFEFLSETFNPHSRSSVRERFRSPHHYDIQILEASSP
jgi:hypothetical protein